MDRKTRMAIGNTVIAASTLLGGVLVTNQLTVSHGGLFGSTSSSSVSSGADKTVQSDPIAYRYGTVQVEVVRSGGKITAINMLQSDASAGRDQAYPMLVSAAIQAQGSNFANISGATFTTDAFKQALDSAISKLG